jgi:hypothetical protein
MFTAMVPLGPGELEQRRLADLIEALAHFEPGPWRLVIADDDPEPRELSVEVPAECELNAVRFDRRLGREHHNRADAHITPMILNALAETRRLGTGDFVLKLDTDALVIAPFANRLRAVIAANPDAGVIGGCREKPDGTRRDFSAHVETVRAIGKPPIKLNDLNNTLRRRFGHGQRPIRRAVAAARHHGYEWAEHCLGGAYALTPRLLDRLHGTNRLDPAPWLHVECSEDVALGLLCRSVGLHNVDDVKPNAGVFGLSFQGLPMEPAALLAAGYGITHAVKNHPGMTEDEVRAFFRNSRSRRLRG